MSRSNAFVPALPDIQEVQPYTDNDRQLFAEVKAVLERHDAASRFGLTLLHSHFPVESDEVLCETTDVSTRTQTVVPIQKSELKNQPYITTSWRLDLDEPLMACICVPINGHGHFTKN